MHLAVGWFSLIVDEAEQALYGVDPHMLTYLRLDVEGEHAAIGRSGNLTSTLLA